MPVQAAGIPNVPQSVHISWDKEITKKNLKETVKKGLDFAAPHARTIAHVAVEACSNRSPTTAEAVLVDEGVTLAKGCVQGACDKTIDVTVDAAHTASIKSAQCFKKRCRC